MAPITIAHTLMNFNVSQFGHYNPEEADTEQNSYTKWFSQGFVVDIIYLAIYSSSHPGDITISSSEADFCLSTR